MPTTLYVFWYVLAIMGYVVIAFLSGLFLTGSLVEKYPSLEDRHLMKSFVIGCVLVILVVGSLHFFLGVPSYVFLLV